MSANNFYRIGPMNEKNILEEFNETFFGITISAHLAAYFIKSLPKFILKMNKPFFIDPMTYIIARDQNNIKKFGHIKKSVQKLYSSMDEKIQNILEYRELLPKDFLNKDENLISLVARDALKFQKDFTEAINKGEDDTTRKSLQRYNEILNRKTVEVKELSLVFFTTPYFYFQSTSDPWYNISLMLANEMIRIEKEYPIYPIICFSKEMLLNEIQIDKLVEDYRNFKGIIIWISDFNERTEILLYLKQFTKLIEKFTANGKPLYNLYGDYFSLLLTKKGLTGYSRGIGLSEKRNVDASTGGGGSPERFYLPFLHTYASKTYAREFLSEHDKLLCNCEFCKSFKKSKLPKLTKGKLVEGFFDELNYMTDTKKHFLIVHKTELDKVSELDLDENKQLLSKEIAETEGYRLNLYNLSNQHLKTWLQSI